MTGPGHDPMCPVGPPHHPDVVCFWCEVIAKARADEREHTAFLHEALLRNQLADLRAQVEALRAMDPHNQPVRDAYDAVRALLDGEQP
jgi:alkylation response protein AidB-like acyl-CoA dehydrogenase